MAIHHYIKRPRGVVEKPWTIPDLYAAYGGPTDLPGDGSAAIISFGGIYSDTDMAAFCQKYNVAVPTVINGTSPFQSDPNGADGENMLDAETIAAVHSLATGGKPATIYFIWITDGDMAAAIQRSIGLGCSVLSISWGDDEAQFGAAQVQAVEAAAIAATAGGITILAASGDNDSADGGPTPANVDAPASCPHVLGCGGTMRPESGTETVWNDNPGQTNGEGTGGGYSTVFPAQSWQVGIPPAPAGLGRMVPDVAANADPATGVLIIQGGNEFPVGGTSFVAPFYAGFLAAGGKRLGFINPALWAANPSPFNTTIPGDNGAYTQPPCPGPCTGLGSPKLTDLAAALGVVTAPPTPVPNPPSPPNPPTPPAPVDPVPVAIQALQHALNEDGASPPLVEDGVFGWRTQRALLSWEWSHRG